MSGNYSVRVGRIANLFWENNGFERPAYVPDIGGFTQLTVKIDWQSKYAGTLKLKGDHWNYLEHNGRYYLLVKGAPYDVNKTVYVYSLLEDFWMTYIATGSVSVVGSLVRTNDEATVSANLNLTQNTEGYNKQTFVNVSSETDLVKHNSVRQLFWRDSYMFTSTDALIRKYYHKLISYNAHTHDSVTIVNPIYAERDYNRLFETSNLSRAKDKDFVGLLLPARVLSKEVIIALRIYEFLRRAGEGGLKLIEVDLNKHQPYRAINHLGEWINKTDNLDDLSNVPHYAIVDGNSSILEGHESLTHYVEFDINDIDQLLQFTLYDITGELPKEVDLSQPKWHTDDDLKEVFEFSDKQSLEVVDYKPRDIKGARFEKLGTDGVTGSIYTYYDTLPDGTKMPVDPPDLSLSSRVNVTKPVWISKYTLNWYYTFGGNKFAAYDINTKKWAWTLGTVSDSQKNLAQVQIKTGTPKEEITKWLYDGTTSPNVKPIFITPIYGYGTRYQLRPLDNRYNPLQDKVDDVQNAYEYPILRPYGNPVLGIQKEGAKYSLQLIQYVEDRIPIDQQLPEGWGYLQHGNSDDDTKPAQYRLYRVTPYGSGTHMVFNNVDEINDLFRFLAMGAYEVWYTTDGRQTMKKWKSYTDFRRTTPYVDRNYAYMWESNNKVVLTYDIPYVSNSDDYAWGPITGSIIDNYGKFEYITKNKGIRFNPGYVGSVFVQNQWNNLKITDIPGFQTSDLTQSGGKVQIPPGFDWTDNPDGYSDNQYDIFGNKTGFYKTIYVKITENKRIYFAYFFRNWSHEYYIDRLIKSINALVPRRPKLWNSIAEIKSHLDSNKQTLVRDLRGITYLSPKLLKSKSAWLIDLENLPFYVLYTLRNGVDKVELLLKTRRLLKRRNYKNINIQQADTPQNLIQRVNSKLTVNVMGREFPLNYRVNTKDDYANIRIDLTDLKHPNQAKIYDQAADKFVDDPQTEIRGTARYFQVKISTPLDYIEDIITVTKSQPAALLEDYIKYETFKLQQEALRNQIRHDRELYELNKAQKYEAIRRQEFDYTAEYGALGWTKRITSAAANIMATVATAVVAFSVATAAAGPAVGATAATGAVLALQKMGALTNVVTSITDVGTGFAQASQMGAEQRRRLDFERAVAQRSLILEKLKMDEGHQFQWAQLMKSYYENNYSDLMPSFNDWDTFNMYMHTNELTPIFIRHYTIEGERLNQMKNITDRFGYALNLNDYTLTKDMLKPGAIIQMDNITNIKGDLDSVQKNAITAMLMNGVRLVDNATV